MELLLGFEPKNTGVADRAVKPLRYNSVELTERVELSFVAYHATSLPLTDASDVKAFLILL